MTVAWHEIIVATVERNGENVMYASVASATLITIGALFAVLGLFAGGNLPVMIIGLLAVLAGGGLSVAARPSR